MSAGAAGAGAVAAAAAAAHQAKMREEEERLTTYDKNDLEGWEFKIVRSSGRIKGDKFNQLLAEEAKHGWELVEKFDDYRVRFKRPVERRQLDRHTDTDPYRSNFGLSEGKLVLIILGACFGVLGAIVTMFILLGR